MPTSEHEKLFGSPLVAELQAAPAYLVDELVAVYVAKQRSKNA